MEENGRSHMTLYNLLQGFTMGRGASVSRGGKPATGEFKPEPFPRREGLRKITPGQLLSVRIPVTRIMNGKIEGYQRKFSAGRARSIARWLHNNRTEYLRTLPVIEISVLEDGTAFYTDGQHRAAGAVIEGVPIRAVITRRTIEEARRLFTLQGLAIRPPRNLLIINSDGPFEEYIQDAITCENHKWSKLITSTESGKSHTKMSPTTAFAMLQIYVVGRLSPAGRDVGQNIDEGKFDIDAADQLAALVSSFGSKSTNRLAYSAIGLRAIALTARQVFRNQEPHADDFNRWLRIMPAFQFSDYAYLRSSNELADMMIKYWNVRLPKSRKAQRID